MCTVSYLPKPENNFILTSNRDEGVLREAPTPPMVYELKGKRLLFPKDIAGGSWLGIAEKERAVCLLNGAFVPHKRQLPYRQSRGLVVIDALLASDAPTFLSDYPLENIEPFTLIFIDWKSSLSLQELRWDGQKRHLKTLDPNSPVIWSSCPLYDTEMQAKRERWFKEWQKETVEFSQKNILQFHKTAGEGNPITDLITERGFLRTVSITSIEKNGQDTFMVYENLRTSALRRKTPSTHAFNRHHTHTFLA